MIFPLSQANSIVVRNPLHAFAAVYEVTPATPPDAELDQWQRYTNWQFVRLHQRIDNVMRMLIVLLAISLLPIIWPVIRFVLSGW